MCIVKRTSTPKRQVFWKGLEPQPLPADIVERYKDGKVMAVVGFEVDQVIRGPDGDTSVPITAAYNHVRSANICLVVSWPMVWFVE